MEALNRDNSPPAREGELWIERLKGTVTKNYLVFSRAIWGVYTHWNGRRSIPCFRDKTKCVGCMEAMPARWKGYLHVLDMRSRQCKFLELTPGGARVLLSQLGKAGTLRGLKMTVKRTSADNGRLLISLDGVHHSPESLQPEVDPDQTLRNLWGLNARDSCLSGSMFDAAELIPNA